MDLRTLGPRSALRGNFAQPQQAVALGGQGVCVVFILIVRGIQRVQDDDLRSGRISALKRMAQYFGLPVTIHDDDLEEGMLCARFRETTRPRRRVFPSSTGTGICAFTMSLILKSYKKRRRRGGGG
jgi:hypothetical protein